jgi:hypothetical protein
MKGRLTRAFDIALRVLAGGLAVSLLFAAWHDVSQAYDIWYYHLPFAARLSGIMDASVYAFSGDNAVRFQGFPLFAELLQGVLWRVTGHIQATNLVALGALFGLAVFMRRLFDVKLHLSLLALLAIPLVHIHATSSYVDLPGNACATMLLLCAYRVIVANEPPTPRFLLGCAALAAAAVNTKFQLVPIVGVTAAVLLFFSLRDLRGYASASVGSRSLIRKRAAVFVLALPIVFATPIKNSIAYGNPVWPVELHLLGKALPFREAAYAQSPPHLVNAPRPIRFLRSALEIDNIAITTQRRWSLDQYAPPDHPSCRMGGYFGAYVVVNLMALAWAAWRRRTREAIAAAAVFGAATIVAALVPQSHELRYYMFWMLLLVSLNLVLWTREKSGARIAASIVALGALSVVVWSTSAGFLYASGSTFTQFLAKRADRGVIEATAPGERLCISREPFTFLYAPSFHPPSTYSVQEATSDADCNGARRIGP